MTLLAVIDWPSLFFMLFAALACVFAAAVLFTSNIVRMAFYLTLSLGATSGLFFLAGAHFVGAMQLMIYVGGTLVLLIFGVMLTAQSRFISMRTGSGEWIAALIVGSTLLVMLIGAAFSVEPWRVARPADQLGLAEAHTTTAIGAGLAGVRVDKLNVDQEVAQGMSGYLLPFVIVSVHLLVVLIGAAYMARTKRYRQRTPSEGEPAG
jgi:NADH:ubiquinone oxidoreductase subunit 6 (subunit J)